MKKKVPDFRRKTAKKPKYPVGTKVVYRSSADAAITGLGLITAATFHPMFDSYTYDVRREDGTVARFMGAELSSPFDRRYHERPVVTADLCKDYDTQEEEEDEDA